MDRESPQLTLPAVIEEGVTSIECWTCGSLSMVSNNSWANMSKYITCNKHYVKKDMKRSWGKGKELGERSSVLSCELWGMFFALSSRQLMLCSFAQGKPSIRPAQYITFHIGKRLDIYNSIFFLWSPVSKTWLFSRQEKDFFLGQCHLQGVSGRCCSWKFSSWVTEAPTDPNITVSAKALTLRHLPAVHITTCLL